jgi:hypothetical protein
MPKRPAKNVRKSSNPGGAGVSAVPAGQRLPTGCKPADESLVARRSVVEPTSHSPRVHGSRMEHLNTGRRERLTANSDLRDGKSPQKAFLV